MAWTAPSTWVSGAILTAAQLNTQLRDNMNAIRSPQINVQSTTLTDTQSLSTATATWTGDVITCSITPSATTSKVLVQAVISVCGEAAAGVASALYKGGVAVAGASGDAASNRFRAGTAVTVGNVDWMETIQLTYLDSPATTSATTYSIRLRHWSSATRIIYVNRSAADTDTNLFPRGISTLTLTEVPV